MLAFSCFASFITSRTKKEKKQHGTCNTVCRLLDPPSPLKKITLHYSIYCILNRYMLLKDRFQKWKWCHYLQTGKPLKLKWFYFWKIFLHLKEKNDENFVAVVSLLPTFRYTWCRVKKGFKYYAINCTTHTDQVAASSAPTLMLRRPPSSPATAAATAAIVSKADSCSLPLEGYDKFWHTSSRHS